MEKSQTSQAKDDIEKLRKKLDKIDERIVDLIAKRFSYMKDIFVYKQKHGLPIQNKKREGEVMRTKLLLAKRQGIPAKMTRSIFETIILYSRKEQGRIKRLLK